MLLFGIFLNAATAECTSPVSLKEFEKSLNATFFTFSDRDLPALEENIEETQQFLPCINETISPEIAYRFHLLHGLYYWISKSPSKANQSFSIAKSILPEETIGANLFPEDHTIHEVYDAAPHVQFSELNMPLQEDQQIYFDGIQSTKRPTDNPTILQIQVDQQVVLTQYLSPYMDIPIYTAKSEVDHSIPEVSPQELGVVDGSDATAVKPSSTPEVIPFNKKTKYVYLGIAGLSLVSSYATAISLRKNQVHNTPMWIGNQLFFFSFVASTGYSGYLMWQERKENKSAVEGI